MLQTWNAIPLLQLRTIPFCSGSPSSALVFHSRLESGRLHDCSRQAQVLAKNFLRKLLSS